MKSLSQLSMIGKKAPEFILKDENGKLKSLADYEGSWLVLYFYPKDMTAGCSLEAQEFRDHEYEFNDLNTQIVGISADDVKSHKKFCDLENLNFTLLSDPDAEVCKIYDVWHEKAMFGSKHWGIERTTFLIDPKSIVRKLYSKVKPVGHATLLIEDIQKLQSVEK